MRDIVLFSLIMVLRGSSTAVFVSRIGERVLCVFLTFDQNKHGVRRQRNEATLVPSTPHRYHPSMQRGSRRSVSAFLLLQFSYQMSSLLLLFAVEFCEKFVKLRCHVSLAIVNDEVLLGYFGVKQRSCVLYV